MKILVVGGAGYIGSVNVERLLKDGHEVVVFDNLSRGHREVVPGAAQFVLGDMGNELDLKGVFGAHKFDAVMHFAALSLVKESVEQPALYFKNNVSYGLKLLDAMREAGVNNFIFSSTAAVYGEPAKHPILEDFPLSPTNPYGESKLAFEKILKWYGQAYGLKYTCLRYFNAAGASKTAGEDHDPESHLIPLLLDVAKGTRKEVTIFGADYPTPDGTCIRDYIHVIDLADAHIRALEHQRSTNQCGIFNLGNGRGHSVKEVVDVVREVTGKEIPTKIGARRPGDPAVLVASNELFSKTTGWQPQLADLKQIVSDAWAWHTRKVKEAAVS